MAVYPPGYQQWLKDSQLAHNAQAMQNAYNQNLGQGLNAAAQGYNQNLRNLQALQGVLPQQHYHQQQPRITSILTAFPLTALANDKINKCVAQLPLRLAQKITSISLATEGDDLFFVIKYTNDREIRFNEVDEFPSDADIARIALESTI